MLRKRRFNRIIKDAEKKFKDKYGVFVFVEEFLNGNNRNLYKNICCRNNCDDQFVALPKPYISAVFSSKEEAEKAGSVLRGYFKTVITSPESLFDIMVKMNFGCDFTCFPNADKAVIESNR
ncbi:hypothetical protein [Eubacterium oxidoreducens]|uniref:Uncharacterized protein n=1 Tax=Eubacterium oxidoreducens TaxID=1732 RepID=A0A1G6B3Q4_EUBOX|nr:hypothetical protein [Eubacterium oxidoreducens]SDB15284.1 hypothetical protein SAMN02910417_01134 [Eubacterium oxidoreducens]